MKRSTTVSALRLLALAAIVAALPAVLAHGDSESHGDGDAMDMDMSGGDGGAENEPNPGLDLSQISYFAYPEHTAAIYAHIVLMMLGWMVVLPISVMLSIARSRYTLPSQFVFLAINAAGLVAGVTYNASTPDLYPNNAHHKLGWAVTWAVSAQVLIGLAGRVAGVMRGGTAGAGTGALNKEERQGFIPVSTEAVAEHENRHRQSNDSGSGSSAGGRPDSLRSDSLSTMVGQESPSTEHAPHRTVRFEDVHVGADDDDDLDDLDFGKERMATRLAFPRANSVIAKVVGKISSRAWNFLMFGYVLFERTILILGYVTLCTGIITWARFFEGHGIYTGLAHWIKGAIFFWYGLLTLGRWSGSFGELGWAWNVRPKRVGGSQKWRPSAEFVEGFLIFFYGSTNIFLEHLGNAGEAFSPQDLEHISITVLFIGGGALAMLVESTRVRELLNTTVTEAALSHPDHYRQHAYGGEADEERDSLSPPREYEFSINPVPALVILLLGIMMGSHTQHEMVSAMVHKQWGDLLTGASVARGLTYIILWLKPPRSVLPSRPPTELLTAFGLIAGGTIFMASAEDTVQGMIDHGLDEMVVYTVVLGFVGLLMAWVIILLALKGWAARRESGKPAKAWALDASRV